MANYTSFETTDVWPDPDMGILNVRRRPPPDLPIEVFGPEWGQWIKDAAKAAACPPDYVASPLLAITSTLIGNARWAQATPGWKEPPHLWEVPVGDSGDGKSPGSDCLMRDVVPEIERRMLGDFPERQEEWKAAVRQDKAIERQWEKDAAKAQKEGNSPPPQPQRIASEIEPQRPRLKMSDITIEKVALVLSMAAPKGLLITRDEIAGWLDGMNAYNPSGRAFWVQAYGGRHYSQDRVKHPDPIEIPYCAVAVSGGTQPEKLAQLIKGADDGLLARIQWKWPNPIPFRLGRETPNVSWAIEALDKFRDFDLKPPSRPGEIPTPIMVPLTPEGREAIEDFGREMADLRMNSGGLLRSAYGKARGTALRLSLNFEFLWWCAKDGFVGPPTEISLAAFEAAAGFVAEYSMPMAERVYGDAGATDKERGAATLARWIVKERPTEVHVRAMQRTVRLPGLRTADVIKGAADTLVEADWLRPPIKTVFGQPRHTVSYRVNPKLLGE